jgi:hypothetical protein
MATGHHSTGNPAKEPRSGPIKVYSGVFCFGAKMSIVCAVEEVLDKYVIYDSFHFSPSRPLSSYVLFQRCLSHEVTEIETNLYTPGYLPPGQRFVVRKFSIEFINFPAPWDIGELVRKCTFDFSINKKTFFRCPLKALIEPSTIEVSGKIEIRSQEPFEASIRPTKDLSFAADSGGVAGRLLMHGALCRSIF